MFRQVCADGRPGQDPTSAIAWLQGEGQAEGQAGGRNRGENVPVAETRCHRRPHDQQYPGQPGQQGHAAPAVTAGQQSGSADDDDQAEQRAWQVPEALVPLDEPGPRLDGPGVPQSRTPEIPPRLVHLDGLDITGNVACPPGYLRVER